MTHTKSDYKVEQYIWCLNILYPRTAGKETAAGSAGLSSRARNTSSSPRVLHSCLPCRPGGVSGAGVWHACSSSREAAARDPSGGANGMCHHMTSPTQKKDAEQQGAARVRDSSVPCPVSRRRWGMPSVIFGGGTRRLCGGGVAARPPQSLPPFELVGPAAGKFRDCL
jgi:hypothetical protein